MTEAQEQKAIVAWFRETYPDYKYALRVSMNGVPRHGRHGRVIWAYMRGQGVHKGEADIAILLPRGGFGALLIEHKAEGSTHKLTPEQAEYISFHNVIGNCAIVTRGVEFAKSAITQYMEYDKN